MSETIEQATELVCRAEIVNGEAVVKYSKTEAELAHMRHRFGGVVYDLTTTKGDKEARAARLELVTLRTSLEKQRKTFKEPALTLGRKIDDEAARITAEIKALETPIDEQINADENRRAAEKAERERIEAERIAAHQTKLAAMRGCVARAQGLPSARIAKGIEQVEAIMLGVTAWEEFAAEATTAKQETLAAMRVMFDAAKAREDEDARVEAQRIENERIAAENRAAAERLAEQQRALDAQAAALKAEQDAIDARKAEEAAKLQREADEKRRSEEAEAQRKARAEQEEADRLEREEYRRRGEEAAAQREAQAEIAVAATPAPEVKTYDNGAPMFSTTTFKDNGEPIMLTPEGKRSVFCDLNDDMPDASEKPTLKLGEINARLALLAVTADDLAELGFVATLERGSKLYRPSDFPKICAAIVRHVQAIAQGVAA